MDVGLLDSLQGNVLINFYYQRQLLIDNVTYRNHYEFL
jgi:hypothetical protein